MKQPFISNYFCSPHYFIKYYYYLTIFLNATYTSFMYKEYLHNKNIREYYSNKKPQKAVVLPKPTIVSIPPKSYDYSSHVQWPLTPSHLFCKKPLWDLVTHIKDSYCPWRSFQNYYPSKEVKEHTRLPSPSASVTSGIKSFSEQFVETGSDKMISLFCYYWNVPLEDVEEKLSSSRFRLVVYNLLSRYHLFIVH